MMLISMPLTAIGMVAWLLKAYKMRRRFRCWLYRTRAEMLPHNGQQITTPIVLPQAARTLTALPGTYIWIL